MAMMLLDPNVAILALVTATASPVEPVDAAPPIACLSAQET